MRPSSMTRHQRRHQRRPGLATVVLAAAAGMAALAAAAAQRSQPPFSPPVGALEAASPPLPVGMDPAMRPRGGPSPATATGVGTGVGNGDAPNHPMDHDRPPGPKPEPEEERVADAPRVVGPPASSQQTPTTTPPTTPQQQLVDLMRDGCFAPSDNLGDYNEYGFRKLPSGSQLGAWFVAAGDVDEYFAPAVDASPAAHGGATGPPSPPAAAAAKPGGGDEKETPAPDAGDDADDDAGPGGDDSELSWLLPPGAASGCQAVLDINGERPASIMQTFATVPGGAYRLVYAFAGEVLPHNAGPPPHKIPSFKSMSVFWDGRKIGDVYINSLDKENVGMDWDRASYLVNATGPATTLVVMSTTKGRSGLAVTDFHLYNVTGLPNGGAEPPPPPPATAPSTSTIHPRPQHAMEDPAAAAADSPPVAAAAKGRRGHGAGVLLALLCVCLIVGLGAIMVVGGRAVGLSGGSNPLASLPTFWRNAEEGYGVLGGSTAHTGGHGNNGDGDGTGYQSAYQVELSAARGGWNSSSGFGGGGGGGGGGSDDWSDEDDEVMFTRRKGEKEEESKREGLNGGGGGGGRGGGNKGKGKGRK